VASTAVVIGVVAMRSRGRVALSHSAMYAMASSHSFDVTLGVPIARIMHPSHVGYVYLNQTAQLVLLNPLLLILIELGFANGATNWRQSVLGVLGRVVRNPLFVMTILGLVASRVYPAGLPTAIDSLSSQVASAGAFLGFATLGFALAALGSTTATEMHHCAVLTSLKMLLMPAALHVLSRWLGVAEVGFLPFLGSLPASASVYAMSNVRNLSPRVVGPLVPATLLLTVATLLLPQYTDKPVVPALRLFVLLASLISLAITMRGEPEGKLKSG